METLIQFKTAQVAKEKGFDIDCGWKLRQLEDGTFTHTNCSELGVEQPSQSVLADWLLDNYKLHINICALGLKKWSFMLEELSIDGTLCKGGDLGIQNYSSKQEAFERGLFDALSLI